MGPIKKKKKKEKERAMKISGTDVNICSAEDPALGNYERNNNDNDNDNESNYKTSKHSESVT